MDYGERIRIVINLNRLIKMREYNLLLLMKNFPDGISRGNICRKSMANEMNITVHIISDLKNELSGVRGGRRNAHSNPTTR